MQHVQRAGLLCAGAAAAMSLCSVFSTVSPLGRHLTKVLSFPIEARGPRGTCVCCNYCAVTGLLCCYRIHSNSVLLLLYE